MRTIGGLAPAENDCSAEIDIITRTHGIRFVVQDMGNGVDRLVDASLIPRREAIDERDHDGREKISHPYPKRINDMRFDAWRSLGVSTGLIPTFRCEGWVRAIDERTYEVVSYRVL